MNNGTVPDRLSVDTRQFESLAALQEDGQPDILGEMVDLFGHEVTRCLTEAERALPARDAVALRRVAHTLKGVCGTVGADRMRTLAMDLEAATARSFGPEPERILQALKDEMNHVMTVLARYMH